ncbi:MAG: Coenzyme F420 hydrogenase/dehydrogenase, beta subunit C-terminal domain [Candidatus Methanoperedens sp.]|nr:Coenzyme F420 hydrogenase/dehydrogenase, beta subunit C-terminal domain [Candidatus Methanoperedens sp.]
MYLDIEKHADSRLVKPVARECCVYCGACVCVNPSPGVGFENGELVFDEESIVFDKDLQVCPVINPVHSTTYPKPPVMEGQTIDELLGPYLEICSTRSTNEAVLRKAQIGGTVTSLLLQGMKDEVIDSALLVDKEKGWIGKPRLATTPEEIIELAGTKLSEASVLTCWRDAIKAGYKKLAIVGMPCVTIAEHLIDSSPDFKEFSDIHKLKIGIFCMEAFNYRGLFTEFLKDNQKIKPSNIVKVDVKGRMIIHEVTIEDKIAVHTYGLKELHKYSLLGCLPCHDYTAEYADISIGSVGSEDGWNTTIVRTELGKKLLDSAVASGLLMKKELEDREHLRNVAALKKKLKIGEKTREPASKVTRDWIVPERVMNEYNYGILKPIIRETAREKGSQVLW